MMDAPGSSTRKQALINELALRLYSQREAETAQEWILKGGPSKYGSLVLADFYPTPAQLAEVNFDLEATIKRAERLAQDKGYDMGYMDARNQLQPKEKSDKPILIPLTDAERMDYERLKGKIEGLEESLANLHEQNRKRDKQERKK